MDIISVKQFDKDFLENIFEKSAEMEELVKTKGACGLLGNKVMASLFFEPSTRTRFSFEAAMERLGGKVISATGVNFSSMAKGETLDDTIKTVERYSDVIVIRHPEKGSAAEAAKVTKIPVINAGDGPGEHPTQALLDFYTIRKEKGKIDGLKIGLVGDLKNGRTIHSLIQVLENYDNVKFFLVSPPELKLPEEYKVADDFVECEKIEDCLDELDVIYMTRVQKERFETEEEYLRLKDCYILTPEILEKGKNDLVIMHPLPRVSEIPVEIDDDPRAKYFDQVENGLYVRMAILELVTGRKMIKENNWVIQS